MVGGEGGEGGEGEYRVLTPDYWLVKAFIQGTAQGLSHSLGKTAGDAHLGCYSCSPEIVIHNCQWAFSALV